MSKKFQAYADNVMLCFWNDVKAILVSNNVVHQFKDVLYVITQEGRHIGVLKNLYIIRISNFI